MCFLDLCEKEVINANDCSYLGHVRDIEFEEEGGKIKSIIVPGPGKYLGIFCKDYEFCIPWIKIIKIGPDIILVDVNDCMKRKI